MPPLEVAQVVSAHNIFPAQELEPQLYLTRKRSKQMVVSDVIPFGDRQFLIQLFPVSTIPDRVDFGRSYEVICEITLKDGTTICHECVVNRPSDRRYAVGVRLTDWLVVMVKTDLTQTQLSNAVVTLTQYGRELSEQEAVAR